MKTSLITDLREFLPAKTQTGFANTIYNWSKPLSWPELRHITPQGALSLLICDKYPYFACQVYCQGGYTAILDGAQYGTYASGDKCAFALADIQESGTLTNCPEPLTLHTLLIIPTLSNAAITAFKTILYNQESTETQGVLWAHFNLPQALSLANCFCGENLTNPLLQAITSKEDILKITSAEYAFAQTPNLHYLPQIQGENLSVNAFKGTCLNTAGNDALKQLKIKSEQSAVSAESLSEGCLALEDVKSISPLLAPTDISKMFKNCPNLRRLPALDYANTVNAVSFLENCSSLQNTALDFSSAVAINKLSLGGTVRTPLNTVKSVSVSQNAPFDGVSPQIDVSYTGLNRSALVNLFESLPYNIGYTVVGNPAINNGVVSGFSQSSYCYIANTVNNLQITECICKINIPSSALGQNTYYQLLYGALSITTYSGVSAFTNLGFYLQGIGNLFINHDLQPNSDYWLKYTNDGTNCNAWWSDDGINYTAGQSKPLSSIVSQTTNTTIGIRSGAGSTNGDRIFPGSIDLKNTCIKVNGITWFNGKPETTKNCNITGCSGTNDLSANDKSLATSKGWEILE